MYDPEGINELAAMEADWDLEDPDTWEGVRWNTEGRIVELDLSYMGLSGWLNLEEMTELISLNIDGNDITKLIIPDCTKLKDISCFYNDLTSLDVSGCTELQELDCALNQIESIKLENASLSNLNCTGNLLTELDLSASPNLEELRCGSNNLSTLDLSELSALNTVFCSGNQIIESKNENLLSALSAIENAGGSADLGTQQYNDDYAFNEDELTNLTEFAESSLNLEKLGWDLDDPWSWSGVEWKIYGTEYHISSMNLSGLGLEGTLNLPNADYLESIACDDSALSAINLAGCSNLSSVSCRDAGLLDLDVTECENLTSLNCVGNILPVEDTNDSLSQLPGMELQTGVVSYENQLILDDESAFHEEECATLLNLLNIGSNGDLLNWDTELPGTWEGVTWTPAEEGDIYRVAGLDLSSRELEGELDLRGFEYLTDFDFSCTEIETVRLPENIVIMPEYAFYDSGIREIYLPEGIRILNPYTFAYCEELETVVLPKSLARIGEYAFYGCSKLENAVFLGDAPLTGGGSDFNRFETIFRDTNSAFSITYFSDTAWGEDHPLLTTYHTNTAAENTILFLDPDVTLYSDDTFTALNQYCGHDITVVAATRANNLSGTCWLTVYDEQGRMINALHKEITAEDSMFLCTFDDVEIQYVGTGGCRIQALITDSSGTFTPVSVNMDQTLTKPTAAVAD